MEYAASASRTNFAVRSPSVCRATVSIRAAALRVELADGVDQPHRGLSAVDDGDAADHLRRLPDFGGPSRVEVGARIPQWGQAQRGKTPTGRRSHLGTAGPASNLHSTRPGRQENSAP